ncbi:MAG: hypothetical protein HOH74_31335, partial [Gemmatimonadetes bacterium]|nr:hypothetical protein [Gemmatimonadota bacterium]
HGGHAGGVQGLVNPIDMQDRADVVLEGVDRVDAEAMLDQSGGLHEDVVGGNEARGLMQEVAPLTDGARMLVVVGIKDGVECRGVDEDAHC